MFFLQASAIDEKIGYPEYLSSSNTSELETMYREVGKNSLKFLNIHWNFQYIFDTSYIGNILKLLQIKSKESLRTLREIVDRKGWGNSPPTIVNAFYSASRNQISKEERFYT